MIVYDEEAEREIELPLIVKFGVFRRLDFSNPRRVVLRKEPAPGGTDTAERVERAAEDDGAEDPMQRMHEAMLSHFIK